MSEVARNFREAEVRAENGNGKGPSGCESGIKDRAKWARQEERKQENWRVMEDKKDRVASLFSHQIVDFTPAPASTQPVPSHTFSTHLLQYAMALDSGSKAKYVRCQSRSLEIWPLYLLLEASCPSLLVLQQHAWPRPIIQ